MKFWRSLLLLFAAVLAVLHSEEVKEEKYEFQAEVSRMMDIIINSLYQRKEVFLRELISNSADALDKIRFLGLKDSDQLGTGEERNLEVRISFDENERTLTIKDTGIGFTKTDLVENLGTVAKSGTSNFVEQLANLESSGSGGDLSFIGQFGVGFYSVYLVADRVQVRTKHNEDRQYVWESTADNTFTIKEDSGEPLGRGTEIKLFLKEDAVEYTSQERLEALVKRYSEFVGFPIYLYKKETRYEDEDEDAAEDEDDLDVDDDSDDLEDDDDDEEEEKKSEPKEITTWEWVRLNDQPAIWTRSSSDVTDEEYQSFFKALSSAENDEALTWTHFKAEGEVEFKSILYVPDKASASFYDNYHDNKPDLKLYVRKVLIKDDFDDLLPNYLNFVKGVVDSDDLPLSVSRETIQQAKAVGVISKKLTRKALDMIAKMAKQEEAAAEDDDDDLEEEPEDAEVEEKDQEEKKSFTKFYKEFGKSIKLGVLEDAANKNRLAKLLRFKTTLLDSEDKNKVTSLEAYVERMQPWQQDIYFITGASVEEMMKSPFIKRALNKNAEVLLMDEPIDEYIVQSLTDFDGNKLQPLDKEGVKFGDEDEDLKKLEKQYKKDFKPLTKWLKSEVYNNLKEDGAYGAVDKILITLTKLDDNVPGLIVASSYGHGANMERIMRSQTLGDRERAHYMRAKKILELNPRHPIVDRLKTLVEAEEFEQAKDVAWMLYDSCRLSSGFEIMDHVKFNERLYRMIQSGLQLESLEPVALQELREEAEETDDGEAESVEKQEL